MMKVKSTELKGTVPSLGHVKKGKIKKEKQNVVNRGLSVKAAGPHLFPKIANNNSRVGKKLKNKPTKQQKIQENKTQDQKDNKSNNDEQKQMKSKKIKNDKPANFKACSTPEEPIEAELKKVGNKKAKKLTQTLKKMQIFPKNVDHIEITSSDTNGIEKLKRAEEVVTETFNATTAKVVQKKEKKAAKRQIIKEQKIAEKQTRDPAVEAATVFVGNLPVNTKRVQLVHLFRKFGPIDFIRLRTAGGKVIHKHKQRRNAGSLNAYLQLKNKEKAEKAISLNGVEFKGNHLRVTLATNNSQSNQEETKRTVFVGNLKYSANEESLLEIFSSCGEIDYVRCLRDGDKGCKGVAYVCYKKPDAVGLALELNQTIMDERPINVERFSVKKLGAKEARKAQEENEKKNKQGAKQRIEAKKEKLGPKKDNFNNAESKNQKKGEFRGVKVEGLKKKLKSKKKNVGQMLQLAKRIAPKIKME